MLVISSSDFDTCSDLELFSEWQKFFIAISSFYICKEAGSPWSRCFGCNLMEQVEAYSRAKLPLLVLFISIYNFICDSLKELHLSCVFSASFFFLVHQFSIIWFLLLRNSLKFVDDPIFHLQTHYSFIL